LKNARFFAGYAVDARRVPFAWSPPGRLFAGIELLAGRVLDTETGDVLEGWGEWASGASYARAYAPLGRTRAIDSKVPAAIRSAVGTSGAGALALQSRAQISVLPAAWRRAGSEGAFDAVIPQGFVRLARAGPRPQAALTIGHAARWRAAEMTGMLLQGRAEIFSPTRVRGGAALLRRRVNAMVGEAKWEDPVLVRLRPARIVWWEGWTSGIVRAS
jgi:hypothetical protein